MPVGFGYRAATVMVVTTIYVVATMSCSGSLEPGLVSSLDSHRTGGRPVVTLLILVANNKIQAWRVRALGMLHRRAALLAVVHQFQLEPRVGAHRTGCHAFVVVTALRWPYLVVGVPSTTWPSSGC